MIYRYFYACDNSIYLLGKKKKTLNFSLVSGNSVTSLKSSCLKKKKKRIYILNVLEYIVGIVSGCKVYGCHLYTHNMHFNNLIHHHTVPHEYCSKNITLQTKENRRKIIIFIHWQDSIDGRRGERKTEILQPFGWSGPSLYNESRRLTIIVKQKINTHK